MRNTLAAIWHKIRTFPDHKKTTQLTFLRKLREESQRSKLFQEFSRTENRILGALARLDDFHMNPLIQGHSGTAPETSQNAYGTNQGTNEDDSQSDPHPEADIVHNQTTRNSGPEEGHDTRFVFFQSITHFLLFFSPGLNQKTSYSILFWFFFTTQNITSFGYICNNHLRGRDAFPYLLLHAICCFYGLFGVIFGMHILALNSNGFAYKIIL